MSALLLGTLAVLLLLSSLLSAAEGAVFSVGDSRLRTLAAEGFQGADALRRLRAHRDTLRAALRILVSLLQLTAAALVTWVWAAGLGMTGVALLAMALLLIVLIGEVAPRAIAARWPIRIALFAAPLLLATERWLRLALFPILRIERLLAGERGEEPTTSEEREVREITELGREEGFVNAEEHLLVERAFLLDELTAWDIMVPRVDIFAWKNSLQLRDIIDELDTVPYSRVPVYGETIDDVTGILYIREAYAAYVEGRQDTHLSRLAREPFFVPGSLSLAQLLRDFQARRIHMGIVADEFGGTDGLVTLEDVLEELVGEIVDETDIAEEPLTRISPDELVADGSVDLREINSAFSLSLPQVEHRSLNGFILEELGYVPERGESIERDGLQIDILEATETQVLRARLRKLSPGGVVKGDDQ
jgi:CBS domain containing-hemolysin-like protein